MPTIVSIELGGTGANTAAGARAALGAASAVDSNSSYGQANAAYTQANNAYSQANSAYTQANSAYTAANTAQTTAQNAYAAANNAVLKAGDTITGNLNVAATIISQNVLPNLNVTYNLGSSDKRFKDLYLSNSTIYLGDATITANGSKLVVPAIETSSGINLESQVSTSYSQANSAYTQSNSAYAQANAAYSQANDAYGQANTAYGQANTAYGQANTATTNAGNAYSQANSAYSQANSSYGQANAAYTQANSAYGQANTATTNAGNAYSQANNAYSQANSAYGQANSAYGAANTAQTTAQDAYNQANTATTNAGNAYNQANAAYLQANTAFTAANNSNLKLGGVISGSLNVTNDIIVGGNVYLQGNTTFINVATYQVNDSLMYIAANNILTDSIDIGFVGGKNTSGTFSHTGLARDATDGKYKLFDGLTDSGHVGNVIDFANTTVATLVANIEASSILLSGNAVATNVSVSAAYGQANAAYTQANSSYSQANAAYSAANNRVLKAGDTMTGELVMSATTPSIRFIDTDNSADAYIQAPDGNLRLFADDNSEAANSFIGMYVDGTERLRIANTGNVGIGTTSPTQKLDVVGIIKSSGGSNSLMIENRNDSTKTWEWYAQGTSSSGFLGLYKNHNTLGTPFVVSDTGNVGIGTTSPGYKLDVNGNLNIRQGSYLHKDFADSTEEFLIRGDATVWNGFISYTPSSSTTNRGFKFGAWDNVGSRSDWVTFWDGSVGIGTTNPVDKLDVRGGSFYFNRGTGNLGNRYIYINKGASNDGGLLLSQDNTLDWQILNNTTTGDLGFYSYGAAAQVFLIKRADGNVGIGTSSPGQKLHVRLPTTTSDVVQRWESPSYDSVDLYVGSTQAYFGTISTTPLAFRTNNTERMRIAANGNISIGTTSPSYPFTVSVNAGIANTPAIWLHNSGNFAHYDGVVISNVNDGDDGEVLHIRTNNTTPFNGTSLMLVRGDGNIGIGTTSPGYKLHVEGTQYINSSRISGTNVVGLTLSDNVAGIQTTGFGSQIRGVSNGGNAISAIGFEAFGGTNNDTAISFYTQSVAGSLTRRMIIDAFGNVGVGTTSPGEKLHVQGNITAKDDRFNFKAQRVPQEGSPQNGVYKGYIILAKAYTSGAVGASYVVGKIIMRRGTASTGHNLDVYEVVSSTGYQGETFTIQHTTGGSDGSWFERLVKCTYGGVVYHAIETSNSGGEPSTELFFEGAVVDSPLKLTDGSYVSSISAFGNLISSVRGTTGYIGIGTTNPRNKLHVFSGSSGAISSENKYDGMDDNLILYIPFAEGTGTAAYDRSQYGLNGTLTNGPTWGTGIFGYGAVLDNSNDYISVAAPISNISLGTTMTYSMWIYPTSTTAKRNYLFDLRGDGSSSGTDSYFLYDRSNSTTVTFTAGDNGLEIISSSVTMGTNTWFHVAATRSGNTWRIYLNGIEIKNGTTGTTAITLSNSFRIGSYSSGTSGEYFFGGTLDEAKLWKRTLTANEIRRLYLEGSATNSPYVTTDGKVGIGTTSFNTNGGKLQVADGISFPASQSACSDSNTLDDYEEGTYTPTVVTESGTPTYTYQEGYYTKIGRQVFGGGIIGISNSASLTGSIRVTMPFSSASGSSYGWTGGSTSDGSGFTFPIVNGFYSITLQHNAGTNTLAFIGVGTSASGVNYNSSGVSNSWYFRFNFSIYT